MSLGLEHFDGLRLCSQVRSLERTRNTPILAVAEAENQARLIRGLELGVNDFLRRPIDEATQYLPANQLAHEHYEHSTSHGGYEGVVVAS